jgi:hypothetical protein
MIDMQRGHNNRKDDRRWHAGDHLPLLDLMMGPKEIQRVTINQMATGSRCLFLSH